MYYNRQQQLEEERKRNQQNLQNAYVQGQNSTGNKLLGGVQKASSTVSGLGKALNAGNSISKFGNSMMNVGNKLANTSNSLLQNVGSNVWNGGLKVGNLGQSLQSGINSGLGNVVNGAKSLLGIGGNVASSTGASSAMAASGGAGSAAAGATGAGAGITGALGAVAAPLAGVALVGGLIQGIMQKKKEAQIAEMQRSQQALQKTQAEGEKFQQANDQWIEQSGNQLLAQQQAQEQEGMGGQNSFGGQDSFGSQQGSMEDLYGAYQQGQPSYEDYYNQFM